MWRSGGVERAGRAKEGPPSLDAGGLHRSRGRANSVDTWEAIGALTGPAFAGKAICLYLDICVPIYMRSRWGAGPRHCNRPDCCAVRTGFSMRNVPLRSSLKRSAAATTTCAHLSNKTNSRSASRSFSSSDITACWPRCRSCAAQLCPVTGFTSLSCGTSSEPGAMPVTDLRNPAALPNPTSRTNVCTGCKC